MFQIYDVAFFGFSLPTKLFRLVFFFLQSLVLNVTQEYLTVDVKTVMSKSKILQNFVSLLQETLPLKTNKKPSLQTPQKNPLKPKHPTKKAIKKASGSSLASCSGVMC